MTEGTPIGEDTCDCACDCEHDECLCNEEVCEEVFFTENDSLNYDGDEAANLAMKVLSIEKDLGEVEEAARAYLVNYFNAYSELIEDGEINRTFSETVTGEE